MATKWTDAQLRAITERGNLLVSAAAGSGKTTVLAERVTRLIRAGARVTDFLVVTFTNAAAAEMKKKIARSLALAAADTEDEAESRRLLEASAAVPMASISTLHAFCGMLLRRHFHLAGLDPAFRALDDADSRVMRQDAMEAMLDDMYASGDRSLLDAEEAFGDDAELSAVINAINDFMNKRPDPEAWLDRAVEIYSEGLEGVLRSDAARDHLSAIKRRVRANAVRLRALAAEMPEKQAATVLAEADGVENVLNADGFDEMYSALASAQFGRLTWPRGFDDDELKDDVKRARDALKLAVRSAFNGLSLMKDGGALELELPAVRALAHLTRCYRARYSEAKAERGAIDFDDMEHLALAVLNNEGVRAEYRARFSHIMVDEYQDVNPVQEEIINALRRANDLFLVGDVKQSIYRFRLAEPRLFLDKYAQYTGGAEGRAIDLTANFRSSEPVIRAVNAVFSRIMSRECGDIDYDERAALVGGRGEEEGAVELCVVDEDSLTRSDFETDDGEPDGDGEGDGEADGDGESDNEATASRAAVEARLAADRIRSMVGSFTVGSGAGARPARFGDIAVLLRSARSAAPQWVEALTAEGIPVYSEINGVLTEALEIRTFTDLLRIIDNRRQDIPLAGVLLSPIGGFTVGELAELRCQAPAAESELFDCLSATALRSTALGVKAAAFLSKIAAWRRDARLHPVDELIHKLLSDTGYAEYVAALPGGKRRARNLRGLEARAAKAAEGGHDSVASFIAYMDAAGGSVSEAAAAIGDADVVRIMSVHKSKGLEFPIVILGDLGRKFNTRDITHARVLLDADCGIAMRMEAPFMRRTNALWPLISARIARENLAEEMRVLYVAMTRARDALIMIGTARKLESVVKKLSGEVTPARAGEAKRLLDWLIMAALNDGGGRPLRELAALSPFYAPSSFEVEVIHTAGGLSLALPPMPRPRYVSWARQAAAEGESEADVRFSWRYPHSDDTRLPAKTSVTGLTGGAAELSERPAFLEARKPLSATDKGTAAHALMEHIEIRTHTEASVIEARDALLASGALTQAEADAVDCAAIAEFFASPLGERLAAAERVERELEFNFRLPASRLFEGASERPILLQGVIDCAFLENGRWVLIDYKTDRVRTTPIETAEHHRRQLTLYAEALSQLTQTPVAEAWIRLLRVNESVRLI